MPVVFHDLVFFPYIFFINDSLFITVLKHHCWTLDLKKKKLYIFFLLFMYFNQAFIIFEIIKNRVDVTFLGILISWIQ